MKKETIITAAVFLVVGFFVGYMTEAEFNWNAPQKMTSAAAAPADASGAATQNGVVSGTTNPPLPPGHPPLEIAGKIQELENQAAQNPTDPAPRLELANLYYDRHEYDRAAQWYEKELALDPRNVNARTDLGTAYFDLGRPQDALEQYEASLKMDPAHEPTLFNMIIVNLQGTHDLAAAHAAWKKLHQRNPSYPGLDKLKQSLDAASGEKSGD